MQAAPQAVGGEVDLHALDRLPDDFADAVYDRMLGDMAGRNVPVLTLDDFLGLADAFIVTSESMSMLAEACAMQKPVYMFDMDDRAGGDGQPALPELQATAAERWIKENRNADLLLLLIYGKLVATEEGQGSGDADAAGA